MGEEDTVVPSQKHLKPHGGFLAIGLRYRGGLVVLFTHLGDAQWTEVVTLEHLEEAPEGPHRVDVGSS